MTTLTAWMSMPRVNRSAWTMAHSLFGGAKKNEDVSQRDFTVRENSDLKRPDSGSCRF